MSTQDKFASKIFTQKPKISRKTAIFLAAITLLLGWLFFATNSSYQLSFKARFYYEIGEYERARELSSEAVRLDIYNKMAQTILNQSQISIKISDYIKDGESYLERIEQMGRNGVSNADRERIRLMCEVMIDGFLQLPNSPLVKDNLKERAKTIREDFVRLKKELF